VCVFVFDPRHSSIFNTSLVSPMLMFQAQITALSKEACAVSSSSSPATSLTPATQSRVSEEDSIELRRQAKKDLSVRKRKAVESVSGSDASSPVSHSKVTTCNGLIVHRAWSLKELEVLASAVENQTGFGPQTYCFYFFPFLQGF